MSLLSYARGERLVVAGLAAALVGAVAAMRYLLADWLDRTEIKPQPPATQWITQETEDSLKPSTLNMLLNHYNFSIREVAAKIVCDRAVNDGETLDYLLWGITRPDYDERMRNLRTLAFITDPQSLSKLNVPRAYPALVRSLERCLQDCTPPEKLDNRWFDDYGLRDMAEKLCFMFIVQLMQKYGPDRFIRAGIVEKWLAKQNWGDTPLERQNNFFQYMYKSNRIVEMVQKIQQSPIGRDALEKAGLMPKTVSQTLDVASRCMELAVLDGDEVEPTPRNLMHSQEVRRRRAQHREAMVFNDGTRPLGRSDIIERERMTAFS